MSRSLWNKSRFFRFSATASLVLVLAAVGTSGVVKQRAAPRRTAKQPASLAALRSNSTKNVSSHVASLPPDPSYTLFESGQTRPLALSADGSRLYAANAPNGTLEIFSISGAAAQSFSLVASIPVGLEPVAVAVRSPNEVWVVNHLSDSISIVDVTNIATARVVRTLLIGDEPSDIVFGGPNHDRAFITTAHRGQNSPVDPQLTTPGVGRADVWVFDANNPGATLGGVPLTIVTLFCDTPRALAVTPDGNTVYAAAFRSGNGTTTVPVGSIPANGLPPPLTNFQGTPGPPVGLIVKFRQSSKDNQMHWLDELERSWDAAVPFTLPDKDVFTIDAAANPPKQTGAIYTGVGTVLFNMAVNPVSGAVYVSNTDAQNDHRFEGPGTFAGHSVRGHLAESRITVLSGMNVTPHHLNKHIDYTKCCAPSPNAESIKSLAFPTEMAVSSDGKALYVTAFGSSKIGIFDTAKLEDDSFVPDTANQITVSGGGPNGLVLDESRNLLYVLTRFDDSISVLDLANRQETAHVAMNNPEPPSVRIGRRFLYGAATTSSHGDSACASCHIFGDFDGLAWDLGNPDNMPLNDPGPFALILGAAQPFSPLKGPMTVQSLRGMANHGPMHWRGDRTGGNDATSAQPDTGSFDENAGFLKFNPAFQDLVGGHSQLAPADMQAFADFILQLTYPPNPIRNLDNSLTGDQQAGQDFFLGITTGGLPVDTVKTCNGCHVFDLSGNKQFGVARPGFFGTDGQSSFEGESQLFKIPHMRNLYQKVGKFGMATDSLFPSDSNSTTGDQIRGFGFLHDGSVDTLFRFHGAKVFEQNLLNPGGIPADANGEKIRRQLEAFLLAFDSNMAPIVGQQITLTQANTTTAGPRIDLLEARAGAGECDLVVKGVVKGQATGLLYDPAQKTFGASQLSDTALRALAQNAGDELTFLCTPPGSGARIATVTAIRTPPAATTAGFVSAANPAPGSMLSPGSMASLYGTNLANAKLQAGGSPLPFLLGGTSMTVGNVPAPLFYVSNLQVNFQVPWVSVTQPTPYPLRITEGASYTTITVTLVPYAPAVFTTNGQGSGQASAIIANTALLAAPAGAYPGSRPANVGEFVSLYCTGLGNVKNPPGAGTASPSNPPATTLTAPTMTVGGVPANVSFSGLAPGFVGLYQVNFQIPSGVASGSSVSLVLSISGVSSNTATIAIQ
jgi:uncharacterized protein (TIGR03437 family)